MSNSIEPKKLVATVKLFTGRPPKTLVAHGSHNQKDHGNRGVSSKGGQERVAGKVVESLKETGGAGATIDPRNIKDIKKGVAVGGVLASLPLEGNIDTPEGQAKAKRSISKWVKEMHKRGVFEHEDLMVGAWQNDDGVIEVEPSQIIHDANKAETLGKVRNQWSVYDTGNDEPPVSTGGNGVFVPGNSPLQKVGAGSTWKYKRKKRVEGVIE